MASIYTYDFMEGYVTHMESFLDCVSLPPFPRWSTELDVLLRMRTGMEEVEGVGESEDDEDATV